MIGIASAQKLAPGNKIRIICEQESSLSVERVIAPDGTIELPTIGFVSLAGKYTIEAEAFIEEMARKKLRADSIRVAVMLIVDSGAPIEFSGAVSRNGSIPWSEDLTLAKVVELAQPSGSAAMEAIEITQSDGKVVYIDFALASAAKLRPGDKVFFPRATGPSEVYILGAVARPGSKTFQAGMTAKQLIELAGGFTGHAQLDQIRLQHGAGEPQIIAFDDPLLDKPLTRGDILTIPLVKKGRYVTVDGMVVRPGAVEWRDGMTIRDALKATGGINLFAGGKITVRRVGEEPHWTKSFDYTALINKPESDLKLRPSDLVVVLPGALKPSKKDEPKADKRPRQVVPPR